MRTFALRAAVVISIAIVLSPAPASAKPPGPPKPPGRTRGSEALRTAVQRECFPQRVVSVEEVAAIAAAAEGLTDSHALARVSGTRTRRRCARRGGLVQRVRIGAHRGVFPYHRWIVGQTYWCYHYGADITYRASHTAARVDGVCSGSNEREWKVSGGAGYSWVVVHHEADFSCATPWWYPLNDSLWMEPAFNSYGSTSMTRWA